MATMNTPENDEPEVSELHEETERQEEPPLHEVMHHRMARMEHHLGLEEYDHAKHGPQKSEDGSEDRDEWNSAMMERKRAARKPRREW